MIFIVENGILVKVVNKLGLKRKFSKKYNLIIVVNYSLNCYCLVVFLKSKIKPVCTDAKSDNLVWQRSLSLILMVLELQ